MKMYKMVDYLPIEFMKRNAELASNKTDGHQMFMNEIKENPHADIYVQMLCTSPFIKPATIDNAIKLLKNNKEYDSAILMKKEKFYLWENNKPKYDINHIPNSKDLNETLIESMGLYIHKKESAIATNRRYGNNPYFIFADLEEAIDINNKEDLEFAQNYARGINIQENQKTQLIKHLASTPMISDILDDIQEKTGKKCGTVINGFKCNLQESKVLGKANTLKLRKLKEGEDFNGIYKALESYKGISENDIIVVENELKDYAYFGDLNARLAIRAGACAAVIDGATRDLEQTRRLNFPVFCKNYNAIDVRKRATLDYINKPIQINNEIISPGDLIFIDECSMVVIYNKYKDIVLKQTLNKIESEKNIEKDILLNKTTETIISTHGAF